MSRQGADLGRDLNGMGNNSNPNDISIASGGSRMSAVERKKKM